ncbi:hypothetical protein CLAFUW4_12185 [Fulvia fulva]|uniref:Uncharacterized protein n=1 Tax=Passalora fulva TaxID=5499 RepID=A0A9Q8PE78_PASFU|nr:uncharacterized protein CLAFUR5_11222 [Fulvia fulva]KAK4618665.1 hypothetical protein CLAFUR0_12201 [Fulvia fulva]UJO20824.1 hypothetical protein CLAFUR5_11222 [Fulvia fulva]WPV18326.1 hypothetical protein CLAFUW4_12185 [Fulvia fulva]WPV33611.1 hypothetical protein CLAFUW7_12192 [Fulvia fulva]
MGLAVPFAKPNGTQPFPAPNGTHPLPPGPTGTGAPWIQFPPPEEEGSDILAPPVKRDVPHLNDKRFFPMPNGTVPHPPSPSGTGAPLSTGTGAPWVQFPSIEEQGQQEPAPPVKRQLNELDDILKAPSDSLPVDTAELKDQPKLPKEFIASKPIPVPFNGTLPIVNGTIPPFNKGAFPPFNNGTLPPFNSTGTKPPALPPLPVANLRN